MNPVSAARPVRSFPPAPKSLEQFHEAIKSDIARELGLTSTEGMEVSNERLVATGFTGVLFVGQLWSCTVTVNGEPHEVEVHIDDTRNEFHAAMLAGAGHHHPPM
jgi:hypothetical protein